MRSFAGRLMVLAFAALLLGGCSHPQTGNDGASFVVRYNDQVLASFTPARLDSLPQVDIATPQSHGEKVQHGPTVRSVLDAAGASGVRSVRVEGRDPAQTLTAAELTDQVIVSVTKRSTVKLAGTNLERGRWVRDVTALVVNP